ncbi:hypothetical protein [Methylobacterium mesophilicum]|uniref:hypothetical protein n=1 Tax=Methylobacterium mesophilicum TaxID=39956 RepID=UPI00361C850F
MPTVANGEKDPEPVADLDQQSTGRPYGAGVGCPRFGQHEGASQKRPAGWARTKRHDVGIAKRDDMNGCPVGDQTKVERFVALGRRMFIVDFVDRRIQCYLYQKISVPSKYIRDRASGFERDKSGMSDRLI